MPTPPYFRCHCCTHGISRYYRATVYDALPTPNCDDCQGTLVLIFDFGDDSDCQTLLVNGHTCYTPLVLTQGNRMSAMCLVQSLQGSSLRQ